MTQWLAIGGGVGLVALLFVLRLRLLDQSGPGRLGERQEPWDGRPRRASDRDETEG